MATSPDASSSAAAIAARLERLRKHDAESLRRLRRRVSAETAKLEPRQILSLADALLRTGARGRHVVAFELIAQHDGAMAAVRAADLKRLGAGMASWGEVDLFALVAGRAWRNGQITDRTVAGWAGSANRWWRRAALVSTVPLNVRAQGGTGDAERTLGVCLLLVGDRDAMVVKAMSWALRALAVRDPGAVRAFLAENGDTLAALVVREVRNKLETGRKAGRPKGEGAG
ncbi:MAG: DNA alkylation repair protein [Gemmatimonadota bacterium]|jgi:hypothetical protein